MPAKNNRLYSLILVLLDFLVLTSAFVIAYIARVTLDSRPLTNEVYAWQYFISLLSIVPLWIVIFASLGLYSPINYNRRLVTWGKIILGCFIGILLVIGWEYIGNAPIFPARLVAIYSFLGTFTLIIIEREIAKFVRAVLHRRGKNVSRVLLIGATPINYDLIKSLHLDKEEGYAVAAVVGPKKFIPECFKGKKYGSVNEALKNLHNDKISSIIQTSLYEDADRNRAILSAAQSNHISYSFMPGEPEFYAGKNEIDLFLGYPVINVFQTPLIGWGQYFKRFFDLLVLIILSPIWLVVLGLVLLTQLIFNPGPIFFKQKRLGQYKRPFYCYKFRTMKPEYSGKSAKDAIKIFQKMGREDLVKEYEQTHKVKDDPRITRFGKILRQTSLDETAQIINVLKGDMSLVGPRPIMTDELKEFRHRGSLLLSIKPGITGLASVSGRSDLPFSRRVDLELYYTQNWSFWMDLKILFKTIRVVISRSGSH